MNRITPAVILLFLTTTGWTHGEDKFGPHGGYIRMPSNYHTEVKVENNRTLKVYLLDLHWKNPTIQNSTVEATHKSAANQKSPSAAVTTQCEPKENFFLCQFPSRINLTRSGEIKLATQRDGQKGVEVLYPLPLKLEKPAAAPKTESGTSTHGHGGHH